jgi:hypothetical protein
MQRFYPDEPFVGCYKPTADCLEFCPNAFSMGSFV